MNRWYHLWRRLKSGTSSGPFSRFSRHWITWNECSVIKKLRWDERTKSDSRSTAPPYTKSFQAISRNWTARVKACDAQYCVVNAENSARRLVAHLGSQRIRADSDEFETSDIPAVRTFR